MRILVVRAEGWNVVMSNTRARWDASRRRRSVDNPHAMRSSGAQFGYGVRESAEQRHIEYWVRVLPVSNAALREDDREEVNAR